MEENEIIDMPHEVKQALQRDANEQVDTSNAKTEHVHTKQPHKYAFLNQLTKFKL